MIEVAKTRYSEEEKVEEEETRLDNGDLGGRMDSSNS